MECTRGMLLILPISENQKSRSFQIALPFTENTHVLVLGATPMRYSRSSDDSIDGCFSLLVPNTLSTLSNFLPAVTYLGKGHDMRYMHLCLREGAVAAY